MERDVSMRVAWKHSDDRRLPVGRKPCRSADLRARMRARRRETRMRVRQPTMTQGRARRTQRAGNRKPSSKAAMHAMNMAKQALVCTREGMSPSARAAARAADDRAASAARCRSVPGRVALSRCSGTLTSTKRYSPFTLEFSQFSRLASRPQAPGSSPQCYNH